jgi:hypothetical protein
MKEEKEEEGERVKERAKERAKEKAKEKEKVVEDIKHADISKNNIYYQKNNLKTIKYYNMSGFSSVGRACDCRSLAVVITRSVVRIRQPGTKIYYYYLFNNIFN